MLRQGVRGPSKTIGMTRAPCLDGEPERAVLERLGPSPSGRRPPGNVSTGTPRRGWRLHSAVVLSRDDWSPRTIPTSSFSHRPAEEHFFNAGRLRDPLERPVEREQHEDVAERLVVRERAPHRRPEPPCDAGSLGCTRTGSASKYSCPRSRRTPGAAPSGPGRTGRSTRKIASATKKRTRTRWRERSRTAPSTACGGTSWGRRVCREVEIARELRDEHRDDEEHRDPDNPVSTFNSEVRRPGSCQQVECGHRQRENRRRRSGRRREGDHRGEVGGEVDDLGVGAGAWRAVDRAAPTKPTIRKVPVPGPKKPS